MGLPALVLRAGWNARHSGVPLDFVTGTGADPRPRLRVDAAQTSFFEGREFRSFLEFNIAAGATLAIRFTSAVDFVLHNQTMMLEDGWVRYSARASDGVTPGGVFTSLPVIGKNRRSDRPLPLYASQVTLASGGTVTGGTTLEAFSLRTSNATAQASSVGESMSGERGLPAGTYYLTIQNLGAGAAVGSFHAWWEEVQPRSPAIY